MKFALLVSVLLALYVIQVVGQYALARGVVNGDVQQTRNIEFADTCYGSRPTPNSKCGAGNRWDIPTSDLTSPAPVKQLMLEGVARLVGTESIQLRTLTITNPLFEFDAEPSMMNETWLITNHPIAIEYIQLLFPVGTNQSSRWNDSRIQIVQWTNSPMNNEPQVIAHGPWSACTVPQPEVVINSDGTNFALMVRFLAFHDPQCGKQKKIWPFIVIGVLGGLLLIALIFLGYFSYRHHKDSDEERPLLQPSPMP